MTCNARLAYCVCSLDEHPIDVAHHCTANDCGGMWRDDPDPDYFWVVAWPKAEEVGVENPTEPIRCERDPLRGYARRMEARLLNLMREPGA